MERKFEENQIMKKLLEENEATIGFLMQENAKAQQKAQIEDPKM